MGTWSDDPFGNDAALDFLAAIYDHLEGEHAKFSEALRDETPEGRLLQWAHFQRARAAARTLVALLRSGEHEWQPRVDVPPPEVWRQTMLEYLEELARRSEGASEDDVLRAQLFRQAVRRELDELVSVAGPRARLPRRPIRAEGNVERWLRERGAPRLLCEWAHGFGADAERAWRECPASLRVELARALGATVEDVLGAWSAILLQLYRDTVPPAESGEGLGVLVAAVLEGTLARGHAELRARAGELPAVIRACEQIADRRREAYRHTRRATEPAEQPREPSLAGFVLLTRSLLEIGRRDPESASHRLVHLHGYALTELRARDAPGLSRRLDELRDRLSTPAVMSSLAAASRD